MAVLMQVCGHRQRHPYRVNTTVVRRILDDYAGAKWVLSGREGTVRVGPGPVPTPWRLRNGYQESLTDRLYRQFWERFHGDGGCDAAGDLLVWCAIETARINESLRCKQTKILYGTWPWTNRAIHNAAADGREKPAPGRDGPDADLLDEGELNRIIDSALEPLEWGRPELCS